MTVAPAAFNYQDKDDPQLASYPVIATGRPGGVDKPFYLAHVKAGRRVVQYVNFIDTGGPILGQVDERFQQDAPSLPYPNWQGYTGVVDFTPAWIDHLCEQVKWLLSQEGLTDAWLDVFGTQLWTSAWDKMSAAQRDNFTKSSIECADRFGAIRDQYRPDARLWANNTWWPTNGHAALCPVIQNHNAQIPTKASDTWWGYLQLTWDTSGQPAGWAMGDTVAQAQAWAKVPGIGVVSSQSTPNQFHAPTTPCVPYATLAPRIVAASPPSTGGGDDTPPVTDPPADPCADVKAELATASAARDTAVEQAREVTSQLDAARKLIASTRGDLVKIAGSAKTIAGRGHVIPADVGRATGIQTAAERAIGAIDKATAAT
jgi:hypothetical protein